MKKWIIGSTIAAAAIASILFFSTYSLGTTRYVDGTISPTSCTTYTLATRACGAGSLTAYKTIAAALTANLTVAGDRLEIRAGTYVETINSNTQNIPSGTSFSDAPVIAGYLSETVTIQPSGGCEVMNLVNPNTKYLIWDKLIINAISMSSTCGTGISIGYGTNHLRFTNTEIKNVPYSGVFIGFGTVAIPSDGNEFINCNIHDVNLVGGLGAGHCLYITSSNNLVEGCELYNTDGYGVHIYNGTSGQTANNNIVRKNRIHNTGASSSAGIILSSGNTNIAYNNFLYNNQTGIQIATGAAAVGNKVYNNSISNSVAQGILIQSGSSGALVRNNIIYGGGTAIPNAGSGTTFTKNMCGANGTGCDSTLTGNPLFVSSTDLHLQSGSPARDAATGTNPTEFTTDFDGDTRPQGSSWDIGADEFLSGGTPSITINTPNSSTNQAIGSVMAISWGSTSAGSTANITYDPNNSGTFTAVSGGTGVSNLCPCTFNWTVTSPATVGATARIRITSSSPVATQTSASFTVTTSGTGTITVTEPKTGDLFLSGQQGPVRWSSTGISGNVHIDVSRDGGTTWETLVASIGYADGDEPVTYNAPTSSNCKVRVVTSDGNTTGTSSGTFRIGGTRAGFLLLP